MKRFSFFFALGLTVLTGCSRVNGVSDDAPAHGGAVPVPKEFPSMPTPADNAFSAAKAELGRHLFYDTRLSQDFSTSCASCHHPESAFSDAGKKTSAGFGGLMTTRNSMSLTNIGYSAALFWEGGAPTLEQQAIAPIIAPNEFNINPDSLVARLSAVPKYQALFQNAFGSAQPAFDRITKALATFERTLISSTSPFDRWNRGDASALSPSAARGFDLFFNETGDCFHCHGGFNFTDNDFHNNGIDSVTTDEGRYAVTNNPRDIAVFKTPTLRNIDLTAPYMHDGRFATLEEVVRHYNSGGKAHPTKDALIRPLGMTDAEQQDLVAFLKSLTDVSFTANPALQNPWK